MDAMEDAAAAATDRGGATVKSARSAFGSFFGKFRILDIALLALGIAAVVLVSGAVLSHARGRLMVQVTGDGGEWLQPLDTPAEIEVPGPLGSTWVHIEADSVRIEKSPCPNQTCVAAGAIEAANQWVACLPNRVFVRIVAGEGGGADEEEIDAAVF